MFCHRGSTEKTYSGSEVVNTCCDDYWMLYSHLGLSMSSHMVEPPNMTYRAAKVPLHEQRP
jgi:hypothetical protein